VSLSGSNEIFAVSNSSWNSVIGAGGSLEPEIEPITSTNIQFAGKCPVGHAGVEVLVEAPAGPGVVSIHGGVRLELHLVFVGTAAASELPVHSEAPGDALRGQVMGAGKGRRVRIAVLGGWGNTTSVPVGTEAGSSGDTSGDRSES